MAIMFLDGSCVVVVYCTPQQCCNDEGACIRDKPAERRLFELRM